MASNPQFPLFTIKEKESLRIGNVLNIKAVVFLRGYMQEVAASFTNARNSSLTNR